MPRTKTTTPKVKEEAADSKIKVEPDLKEIKEEEFTTPAVSKKVKISKSRALESTKIEEIKTNSKVLGKRPRKMKSKKFIDDEAEESDGDDLQAKKEEANTSDLLNQFYEVDDLKPQALRLDQDFIAKMEERALRLEKDELKIDETSMDESRDSEMIKDEYSYNQEEIAQMIVRDVTLPSNKDSKLWRIKVKPGMERQLVLKLTNKLIQSLNNGTPLFVLQVFECQSSSGSIYLEAHKLSHVEQLIRGMSGIYSRGLKMIPISEMTDVMKACSKMKENPVQPMQWVRVKKGPFQGDLGLVQHVIDSRKAIIRILPRIPESWLQESAAGLIKETPRTFNGLSALVRGQPHVKIPQRMFNPTLVRSQCQKEVYKPLGKSFFVWKEMMFRNGMLYHPFSLSKLDIENVCPMLEEVEQFQVDSSKIGDMVQFDSDQDEWDLLPDHTLLKTIRNDSQLRVQVGDRCKVFQGQFQGCQGIVQYIDIDTKFASLLTEAKVPVVIKDKAENMKKFFEVGESVRVLQGVHLGEGGLILEILKPDETHALLLMEDTKQELRVLISNLRRNKETCHGLKHSLSTMFNSSQNLGPTNKERGQTFKQVYSVGDLVLFDGYSKVGLVLKMQLDNLKVLLQNNQTTIVKLAHIQKRIAIETRMVSGKKNQIRHIVTDKFQNAIMMRTIVKPCDQQSPFYNCIGEVRAIHKDYLFLFFAKTPNQHLLRDTNYFWVFTAKQVVNVGHEQISEKNTTLIKQSESQGYMLGKLDKLRRDVKAAGQTIFIARGPLKGYKGKIVSADDFTATIQIFAKGNIQVTLDRDAITSIQDDTQAMRLQDQAPMQISFDEAMGQEFVNVPLDELGNPIVGKSMDLEDGGATPVREDTAQEW